MIPFLADALRPPLPSRSVDLVIGSPPYCDMPRYGPESHGHRSVFGWVEWMIEVTKECLHVSRGFVVWVVNDPVRQGRHIPGVDGLAWEWFKADGHANRPVVWHKNAPPNGAKTWFSNQHERILCFKRPGVTPRFDWENIGHPPKYKTGGRFRQRTKTGVRKTGGRYPTNPICRPHDVLTVSPADPQSSKNHDIPENSNGPSDVLRVTVGGGHMGSKFAHADGGGEAPFPEKLVEPLIRACVPVGGLVFDPFCGSGTTAAVCKRLGRRFVTSDVRANACDLARRRLDTVELDKNPEPCLF